MSLQGRPYLIIPRLIEQQTWGGSYILEFKNWLNHPNMKGKKIGQSYELFGQSKLLTNITDSKDPSFQPEFGTADGNLISTPYKENEYIVIEKEVVNQSMPILIKFTQAAGNSFQLHVKPGVSDQKWKPKPESWYYFEDGLITFGIRRDVNLADYKKTCEIINNHMVDLSQQVKDGTVTLGQAKQNAAKFIRKANPWQFVNTYQVQKHCLIDLSMGGLHHSWEENKQKFPLGNVLYEVQMDVMDPVSTIRAFDQGKIKDNGDIRPIAIDEYFKFLDPDPEVNDFNKHLKKKQDHKLIETPYYSLDIFEIKQPLTDSVDKSFCHLFVREGEVRVKTQEGSVHIGKGHACFIPAHVKEYQIEPLTNSVVLKTYIS